MMLRLMMVGTVKAGMLTVRIDMLVQAAHLQDQQAETGNKQYHTSGILHGAYYKR